MSVPPRGGRRPPSPGAQHATAQRGKNRPKSLPLAAVEIPEWCGSPTFFSVQDAEAVITATRLTLAPGSTPDALATRLSAAAYPFFYVSGLQPPSPAGTREAWARNVAKHACALLANFGMDPDTLDFSPPPDGFAVLLGSDYPPELRASSNWRQMLEDARKTDWFRRAMRIPEHPAVDPAMSQAYREWWSLCGAPLSPSFPPEPEAFRVTLMGVAHLAHHAAFSAEFYRQRKKELRRLTPLRRFVISLCRAYQEVFGKPPTRSAGGPAVRFCTAVAQQLLKCDALPDADPALHRQMRRIFQQRVKTPGTIVDRIRDVKATKPREDVWRRRTTGGRRGRHPS